jgi:two-component system, LytTR family, sensor histidine kinase AgrC
MKSIKLKLILALSIFLLVFFASLNVYISYVKIKRTVVESIASQSLEAAKSMAFTIDTKTYEQFLKDPVKNDHYWEISSYLDDARKKIGALYVYTLAIDNPKFSTVMIMGLPKEDSEKYPIGIICTVPEEQVREAIEGKTFVTEPIEDVHLKTSYITVGAPIKDEAGKVLGYLAIDISVETLDDIGERVLKDNIWSLVFSGLLVCLVILAFLIMQRWYQKEVAKEVEYTEDTYQTEIKTLISSVSSLRHDFINHIQVLYGFLKIGNANQALDYASTLFKEAQAIESIKVDIDHPGLSILLQIKKLSAQNHNINMQFTISDDSFNKMKTNDLIIILSNLIDNAIDAAIELPESERSITIDCMTDSGNYVFKITNTGPRIIEKEQIFKQGYSTKKAVKGEIRGQGLFIVKEVINKYNGSITIESTDLVTTAMVKIPIR